MIRLRTELARDVSVPHLQSDTRMTRTCMILAVALVALALASFILAGSGVIVTATFRLCLWIFAASALWLSVFLFRRSPSTPRELLTALASYFATTATVIFTSLSLFLLLNLALDVTLKILERRDRRLTIPHFKKYGNRVYEAYAGLAGADVERLLIESFQRPLVFESFTQFRERPFSGRFVTVHPAGFRDSRNGLPWPPAPENLNVFVFGGSTTFGYGVPDDQTIPAHLQREINGTVLPRRAAVYNFGAGFYFSTQERILFETHLLEGVRPDVAVFIDGLNDIGNSSGVGYWTETLRKMMERRVASRDFFLADPGGIIENMPIIRLLRQARPVIAARGGVGGAAPPRGFAHASNTANNTDRTEGARSRDTGGSGGPAPFATSGGVSPSVILDRYARNQRIIRAIARDFGIRTVFVWQPIPAYGYDLNHHPYHDGVSMPGSADQREFEAVYKDMARRLTTKPPPPDFLYLADLQKDRDVNFYVDSLHYTPEFSAEIARHIFDHMYRLGLFLR